MSYAIIKRLGNSIAPWCGGKANNLTLAIEAGLPVPQGVVISQGEPNQKELYQKIRKLRTNYFAVRSSYYAEDSTDRSFAGVFSSVAGIDLRNVIDSIGEIRRSLWGMRSRDYHSLYGMVLDPERFGVIVQRFIFCRASGVAFSQSGKSDTVLIEAVSGGASTLVGGSTNPDRIWVSRRHMNNIKHVIGFQTLCQNGTEAPTRMMIYDPKVSQHDIGRILELLLKVETLAGKMVDIEWGISQDDSLWLLQWRPITAEF